MTKKNYKPHQIPALKISDAGREKKRRSVKPERRTPKRQLSIAQINWRENFARKHSITSIQRDETSKIKETE